jgi:hypothetical protein
MPITVTDLAAEVKESNLRLTAAIENLNVEVARINVYLSFIRTALRILIPVLLVMLVSGIGASYKVVWDTARLHSSIDVLQQHVGALKEDIGLLKQEVGGVKQDMGDLKQDIKTQQAALSRIEKAVVH